MAIFRGTQLYMRTTDQDQAWGTNVRSLLSTAAADTNFTVTFTSTTAITQTVNPYTNISNVSADNRTNLGWAMNESSASTDSMGSTSTAKRIIPAGTWTFNFGWSGSAPALLTTYNVTIEYSVYRVATGGGTRTLLFSVSAAPVTISLTGGSGTGNVTSSQSEYIIQAGETIHVAVRITSAATSALLGGTTNTVITCNGATSGAFSVAFPSPGLRTLYLDSSSATGVGSGTRSLMVQTTTSTTGVGSGTRSLMVQTTTSTTGVGSGTRSLLVQKDIISSAGVGSGTRTLLVQKDIISSTGVGSGTRQANTVWIDFNNIGVGSGSISRLLDLHRSFTATGSGTSIRGLMVIKDTISSIGIGSGAISRALDFKRSFAGVGIGDGQQQKNIYTSTSTTGVGDATIIRSVIFVRQLIGTGVGVGDIAKSVIFVRSFNSTGIGSIKPRIALDWDDLPDPGGGGVIIYELYPRHRIVNK